MLVSTLHNAKGHEFRAIFILGLYEGALPLYSAAEEEEVEREPSLLYVAMTRAKELLYLSYSSLDMNNKPLKRSHFLTVIEDSGVRESSASWTNNLAHTLRTHATKVVHCDFAGNSDNFFGIYGAGRGVEPPRC